MDPQQRLLLEVAYEALEDAGQPLPRIAGTDTGVFIGQLGGDYWHLQYDDRDQLDLYAMTGAAARAITSGRLSYAFDLRGPSFTVDTACSSALVAVHNAVQAIRLGECPLAIAGGVNLVLLPEEGVVYSGAGMLASDGRCKFADASGDGFVRSDGIGAVILKPLSAALADGDRIRAVIRGSAVGNDGQSSGYLVTPAVEGQRDVLRRAYANAAVDPADIDYIEAHGTGTSVGDPVELQALADIVGARASDDRCLVGSVKTNIGHAEAAAGIAGLIKAVLCLENKTIPPNLHLKNPNPTVDWANLPLAVPTHATPLPQRDRPAIAGVSSFGFSGTNAHLVLEAAPEPRTTARDTAPDARSELLVLSALSPEALSEAARSMADHLEGPGARQKLRDIAHSAALRRTPHDARLALPVQSHAEAAAALRGSPTATTSPACPSATTPTPRRRHGSRSCSPDRARSGQAWAASSWTASRSSTRPCGTATTPSGRRTAGQSSSCCARRMKSDSRNSTSSSPPSGPSRSPSPSSGAPGASNRTWSSATAWVSPPPPTSPALSRSLTPPR